MNIADEYQVEENQHMMIWKHYVQKNALRNKHFVGRKGLAFYWISASQRQMEKLIKQSEMSWKAGILLREMVELFIRGWVSWCWISNRDDAKNEKNN